MDYSGFDDEKPLGVVNDEELENSEMIEKHTMGRKADAQGGNWCDDEDERERINEEGSYGPSTIDDLPLIQILSFLGFCVAALGWVVFFSSRLITPRQDMAFGQSEEKVLNFYSHVAVDLYPREAQDPALSNLPLSSDAAPSVALVSSTSILSTSTTAGLSSIPSTLSTSISKSVSSTTLPNSSLTTIPTASSSPVTPSSSSAANATATGILQVFQLDPPVMGPGQVILDDGVGNISTGDIVPGGNGGTGALCQVTLMEHEFKDSFGQPFVGKSLCENAHLQARVA